MKKSTETLEEAYQRVKREQYFESNEQLNQSRQQQQQQQVEVGQKAGGGRRLSRVSKKKRNGKEQYNESTCMDDAIINNSTTSIMKNNNNAVVSSNHPNDTTNSKHNNSSEIHTNTTVTNINDVTTDMEGGEESICCGKSDNMMTLTANISSSTLATMSSNYHNQIDLQHPPPPPPVNTVHSIAPQEKTPTSGGPRRAMSNSSIKKDESKLRKILIRLLSGILMVTTFVTVMYCGHIYLCTLIFFTEVMLFKELITVRYNTFFHIIEETIPLFRTTQWMWFITAIFYTYSDFAVEVIKSNTSLHYLWDYAKYQTGFAFLLYATTFMVSIITLHKDHIKFQINQLCWTILVLCMTVGQLKYVMHNVYNGLIWFTLPIMLVVFNDSFAWLAGVTCGKKFIQKPLNKLSPNKTWEGFVGGWIGTMIAGWYFSSFLSKFTWMTCPAHSFSLFPEPLECDLDPIFLKAKHFVPSQIFEIIPRPLVHLLPGVVDICMIDGNVDNLTACISGEGSHTHHHFELVLKNFYPIQLHTLSLSLFASFVAPFGGFAASAIKRAYGLKDFGSFFPGHGGMMDRMDCQFLMALCTWVHYNTFVKMATVSVPKMIYMFHSLNDAEKKEFLEKIVGQTVQNVVGQCQVAL